MSARTKNLKKVFLPLSSKASSFHIEIDKSSSGFSALISDVLKITDFSNEEIKLRCHGANLILKGKSLTPAIYENKTVEISGSLEVIEFVNTKN